jgi:MFS family permease
VGASDSQDASAPADRVSAYGWYALCLLVLVYAVNFLDRQILSILAADIKADLHLDDSQIGFLYGTAFAIFYALFGFPLGRLADHWYRGRLIAIGLGLWSAMTIVSGFASSFAMLAFARIGVGIGEASASPAAYSMIADHFPRARRATALSIYSSGLYIGGALSLPIGGLVASRWKAAWPHPAGAPLGLAGWQAAFLAVGLPGLLLACWVWSLREPRRGASDGPAGPQELRSEGVDPGAWRGFGAELAAILPPLTLVSAARAGRLGANLAALAIAAAAAALLAWATGDKAQWLAYGLGCYAIFSWVQALKRRDPPTHRLIWGCPNFLILAAAIGSISLISYAISFWASPYALRTFYSGPGDAAIFLHGLTAREEAAALIGWPAALAAAAGAIGGGLVADAWRRRDPRGRIWVMMLSVLLPAPAVLVMFTTKSPIAFYLATPVAQMFGSAWVGASVATLQDLVLPRMRATAGATYVLGTTMIGLAIGPYAAGKVADLTHSLAAGIFALYLVPPFTLAGLWLGARRIAALEASRAERARAVGEPI